MQGLCGDLSHRFTININFVLKTKRDLTTLMWNRLPMLLHKKRRFVKFLSNPMKVMALPI